MRHKYNAIQVYQYHKELTANAPAIRHAHINHAANRRRIIFQRGIVSTATSWISLSRSWNALMMPRRRLPTVSGSLTVWSQDTRSRVVNGNWLSCSNVLSHGHICITATNIWKQQHWSDEARNTYHDDNRRRVWGNGKGHGAPSDKEANHNNRNKCEKVGQVDAVVVTHRRRIVLWNGLNGLLRLQLYYTMREPY